MTKFAFVSAERGNHAVATLCRVIGASVSGFYAYDGAPPRRNVGVSFRLQSYRLARLNHVRFVIVAQIFWLQKPPKDSCLGNGGALAFVPGL